ncbi:MAG TPA: DNA-binding transcriptional regulator [Fimbriimonas sp.]|nr:DNA-binding transcriptional regulator [Fimbriimonas sp.]
MNTSKENTYESPALEALHELAKDIHAAGVMSKQTMRKFDALCLTQVEPLAPDDIRQLREQEGVSQAVLAKFLNVTTNAVSQWERGEKKPTGSALKLLNLVQKKGLQAIL